MGYLEKLIDSFLADEANHNSLTLPKIEALNSCIDGFSLHHLATINNVVLPQLVDLAFKIIGQLSLSKSDRPIMENGLMLALLKLVQNIVTFGGREACQCVKFTSLLNVLENVSKNHEALTIVLSIMFQLSCKQPAEVAPFMM